MPTITSVSLNPNASSGQQGKLLVSSSTNGGANACVIGGSGLDGAKVTFSSSNSGDTFPSSPFSGSLSGSNLTVNFRARRQGAAGAISLTVTVECPPDSSSPGTGGHVLTSIIGVVLDDPNSS